ncbi:MAG: CHAD domain-containing protein [Solirubrobacterales bacterium]
MGVEPEAPARGPSRSIRLRDDEGVADGIRRIASGRAERALAQLAEANGDGLAEAIHGARKELKKMRAILRLSRDGLGGKLFRAENRRYRDSGQLLSVSRDAEAKLEALAALGQRFGGEFPGDARRAWAQTLADERDGLAAVAPDRRAPEIERAMAMIEAGRDSIPSWPLEGDYWDLIGSGLARSYRQGRSALKRATADPNVESIHEWRKRTKDLTYQLRILVGAWPPLLGETADQAHELSDLLGDHHDLAVLANDLSGRDQLDGGRKALQALIEKRQVELLAESLEIGARLYAEKPIAFNRRMEAYWSAWRAP